MAKVSSVKKNERRRNLALKAGNKRNAIKEKIYNKNLPLEERFALVVKLSQMPRNAAGIRVRNRCELTGRPRGYYRKFGLARNMLRDLAGKGLIPGVVKASW